MSIAVVVISGGMDSTTAAYQAKQAYDRLSLVSFDYNQKHGKELGFAAITANKLDVPWHVYDMPTFHSSVLTSDAPVPEGHYAEENMKATVVPNRNMIMLSIAVGHAVDIGAEAVITGVHAGDHPIYPDCRPEFIVALDECARMATKGFAHENFNVIAPFVDVTKADIVTVGEMYGVPWEDTWSCYQGGVIHCGRCGTCVERKEAFRLADVKDPTEYESPDFEIPANR